MPAKFNPASILVRARQTKVEIENSEQTKAKVISQMLTGGGGGACTRARDVLKWRAQNATAKAENDLNILQQQFIIESKCDHGG